MPRGTQVAAHPNKSNEKNAKGTEPTKKVSFHKRSTAEHPVFSSAQNKSLTKIRDIQRQRQPIFQKSPIDYLVRQLFNEHSPYPVRLTKEVRQLCRGIVTETAKRWARGSKEIMHYVGRTTVFGTDILEVIKLDNAPDPETKKLLLASVIPEVQAKFDEKNKFVRRDINAA